MEDQDQLSAAARLREARTKAGFASAAAAARKFGWGEAAYRHHENGTRSFSIEQAQQYASAFLVSIGWLLGIRGKSESVRLPVARFYMEVYAHSLGEGDERFEIVNDVFDRFGRVLIPELRVSSNEFAWIEEIDGRPPFHFVDPADLPVPVETVTEGYVFAFRVRKRFPSTHLSQGDILFIDSSNRDISVSPQLWLMRDEEGPFISWAQLLSNGETMLLPQAAGSPARISTDYEYLDLVGRVIWHGGAT